MIALVLATLLASGLSASDRAELVRLERDVRCRVLTFDQANLPLLRRSAAFIQATRAGYDRILREPGAPSAKLEKLEAHRRASEPRRRELAAELEALDGKPSLWLTEAHEALADFGEALPEVFAEAARGRRRPLREKAEELDRLRHMMGVWRKEITQANLRALCAG